MPAGKHPEKRARRSDKSGSILLKISGTSTTLELFPSTLWPSWTGATPGAYRVRVNGAWDTTHGKYSFYTLEGVHAMLARLIMPQEYSSVGPVQAPRLPKGSVVSAGQKFANMTHSTRTITPPFQGPDGRWRVFVCGVHDPVLVDALEIPTRRNNCACP